MPFRGPEVVGHLKKNTRTVDGFGWAVQCVVGVGDGFYTARNEPQFFLGGICSNGVIDDPAAAFQGVCPWPLITHFTAIQNL